MFLLTDCHPTYVLIPSTITSISEEWVLEILSSNSLEARSQIGVLKKQYPAEFQPDDG